MTVYKDNCLSYLKAGYPVTPAIGKHPAIKKWTTYCEQMPTREEVIKWCKIQSVNDKPVTGIDLCLGKQSGIIVLDFDETNQELIDLIEPMLPDSPVERVGQKGFARFFQYSGEATQNVKYVNSTSGKSHIVLEVLSNGKKITLPPSIHPKTKKPYIWSKKSLLEIDKKDLPKFPPMLVSAVSNKLQMLQGTSYTSHGPNATEGRVIALTAKAAKIIKDPHTVLSAIQDLITFDKENHLNPLFYDSEDQEFKNPELNAFLFYTSILRSINQKRVREQKDLEIPLLSSDFAVFTRLMQKSNTTIDIPLPQATGLLKEVSEYITSCSYVSQPMFAISATFSLLAVLASRKFRFQNITPNLYVLNIGSSGSGKDLCQQAIKKILYKIGGEHLLGAAAYPSEASLIQHLDIKPVRLDIIDEAATFLNTATQGQGYAQGIGDTLCELYSSADSQYLGKALASNTLQIGAVSKPHVNLLCSTTYKGLNEGISLTALEKGLFARFLLFFGNENQASRRLLKFPELSESIVEKLQYLLQYIPYQDDNTKNFIPFNHPMYKVPCTEAANQLLAEYHLEFDNMRLKEKKNSEHRPIIARLYQHMLKITLLSAVGNITPGNLPIVKPQDVQYAYHLIKYFYHNITEFISDNLYESFRGMKINKILKLIKQADKKGITNKELVKHSKFLNTVERLDIIKDLKESGSISIIPNDDGSIKFYYIGGIE